MRNGRLQQHRGHQIVRCASRQREASQTTVSAVRAAATGCLRCRMRWDGQHAFLLRGVAVDRPDMLPERVMSCVQLVGFDQARLALHALRGFLRRPERHEAQ